jgi:hypothetical protein
MKECPTDTTGDISSLDSGIGEPIPRSVAFPIGVGFINQIYQLPATDSTDLQSSHPMEKRKTAATGLPLKPIAFGRRTDITLPPILEGVKVRPVAPISYKVCSNRFIR